jgi:AP2-associated kinase
MYRPPEMIDKYRNWPVSNKVDVWMLGCIVYTMCFAKHPFMEQSALAIMNATYYVPSQKVSQKMLDFVRYLLCPDPRSRPSSAQVLQTLRSWSQPDFKIVLPQSS